MLDADRKWFMKEGASPAALESLKSALGQKLPANYLDTRIAKSTDNSFSVSFPCEWLLLEPGFKSTKTSRTPSSQSTAPDQTLPSLQLVLQSHLHEHDLNADRVAELCGTSKRTLARRLAELGTSLKAELDALRRKLALGALSDAVAAVEAIKKSLSTKTGGTTGGNTDDTAGQDKTTTGGGTTEEVSGSSDCG